MGVRAQKPLWRTLPTGGGLRTRAGGGGRVTGEGAREGGRGESAIQGEAGAAGARRRRGPEAPRRARRARSSDSEAPAAGAPVGPGAGMRAEGGRERGAWRRRPWEAGARTVTASAGDGPKGEP